MGEASCPGPFGFVDFWFAVINPTTVLEKVIEITSLNAHVILVSETAATAQVQKSINPKLRGRGYSACWGCPVPDRFHPSSGKPGLRGSALGTVTFTSLPCRNSISELAPEVLASCRLSECFVRCGPLELRIWTAYGTPRCLPEAAQKNNILLSWIYECATSSMIPTLVGGDFNTMLSGLPAWRSFAAKGWCELGAFIKDTQGVELPPTCKSATRFDTFLVPPCLQQFVHQAQVLQDSPFDSHSPMLMTLRLPSHQDRPWIWRLPRSWVDLYPESAAFESAYRSRSQAIQPVLTSTEASMDSKLLLWSRTVESSVDQALCSRRPASPQDLPAMSLPRSFRGRCEPRRRLQGAIPQLPRKGRHGDVQPVCETTSVNSRQRLRQCRRLSTLHQGLLKLPASRGLPQCPCVAGSASSGGLSLRPQVRGRGGSHSGYFRGNALIICRRVSPPARWCMSCCSLSLLIIRPTHSRKLGLSPSRSGIGCTLTALSWAAPRVLQRCGCLRFPLSLKLQRSWSAR